VVLFLPFICHSAFQAGDRLQWVGSAAEIRYRPLAERLRKQVVLFCHSFAIQLFKRATACSGSGQRLKSVIVHWQTGCESRWFFFAIHLPFSFSSG